MKNRILHMFQWQLKDIKKNLALIKEQGFNIIQISPIQPLKEYSYIWWTLYQPIAFTIGNDWIGSKDDLIDLCNEAKKYDIKIIADVICNHMASDNHNNLLPNSQISPDILNNKDFWKEPKMVNNWNDRWQIVNYSMGLPGLNTNNHELQDIIIKFLNELIDCGIDGFRFDAGKHIALPEEGCDFFSRVLDNLKNKDKLFNYAEVIFCSKIIIDAYSKYLKVLTSSFGSDKDKLITFVESHDSYYEFKYTAKMNDDMLVNEYRYLTKQYNNTLFFVRQYSDLWKDNRIKQINNNL